MECFGIDTMIVFESVGGWYADVCLCGRPFGEADTYCRCDVQCVSLAGEVCAADDSDNDDVPFF